MNLSSTGVWTFLSRNTDFYQSFVLAPAVSQFPAPGTAIIYTVTGHYGFIGQDLGPYTVGPATLTVSVTQTVAFSSVSTQNLGNGPVALSAIASSGLSVNFISTTPSVCAVSGSSVIPVAAGTCSITATQAGNVNYAAAPPVVQSFTITPAPVLPIVPAPGTLLLTLCGIAGLGLLLRAGAGIAPKP